jgi:Xaa-Pro aminopeptidase
MLCNTDRARELLQREAFDGLVAQRPINQYYLSDYWGLFNTPVGYDGAYFAVFPRAEDRPAALIVPALEIRRLETTGGTWMPSVFAYSSPADGLELSDGTPRGADYAGWAARDGAALTPLEKRWVAITQRLGQQMSPDAFWATARALRAAGLDRARIATDENRLAGWLGSCGLDGLEVVYRPELFNEIRLVKTAAELELMRTAAQINERALFEAVDALRETASWSEIEDVYMASMARQGGRGVYLMCGVGELPAGHPRRGEPIMFDALGQYRRYHGDFGRCAVIGEASAEHTRRHAAICAGWEVAKEMLRPGVRYSELAASIAEGVRAAGIPGFREPVVHSLGLEHTDDPKPPGVQPQAKPDQVLLENMVVNVDMPHTEIGWGSIHMEDTLRITADGWEPLTNLDLSLRVVPAPD